MYLCQPCIKARSTYFTKANLGQETRNLDVPRALRIQRLYPIAVYRAYRATAERFVFNQSEPTALHTLMIRSAELLPAAHRGDHDRAHPRRDEAADVRAEQPRGRAAARARVHRECPGQPLAAQQRLG